MSIFEGAGVALITPMNADGSVNYDKLEELLEMQIAGGTDAIISCGTTGEASTLSEEEHIECIRFTCEKVKGRIPVVVGTGSNSTYTALQLSKESKDAGADALLLVSPYYNKATQAGLVKHFGTIAGEVGLPVILYNIPGRTVIGIPMEAYTRLAEHPNINGVKEASGDFTLIGRVAAELKGKLFLWSGNDDNTIPMMALGALGVVSVASNILPDQVARLCKYCLDGDYQSANELYAAYGALFRALFIETNPIPVKAAMQRIGTDSGILRRPLVPISEAHLGVLLKELEHAGLVR